MNLENFKLVLDHIEAFPESWCQDEWHCGTAHCFAGHAQILSGKLPDSGTVRADAMAFLEIDAEEAQWLFFNWGALKQFQDYYSLRKQDPNGRFGLRPTISRKIV